MNTDITSEQIIQILEACDIILTHRERLLLKEYLEGKENKPDAYDLANITKAELTGH